MIKCTLELCPGGVDSPESNERLGVIFISNDVVRSIDTGGRRGTYQYRIYKKRTKDYFRRGTIRNFPRQSYHPWNLIKRILDDVAESNGGTI